MTASRKRSDASCLPVSRLLAAGLGWGANATRNVPDSWLAAVPYCVEPGADVNAHDVYNYTALHGAAYRGDNAVVKFLVEKGARRMCAASAAGR
jgi:hypothetical protein